MKNYQEQIDEIMDYFDFGKMQKVMAFLDWRWWHLADTPDEYQLRKMARKLLREAAADRTGNYWTTTAGFEVRNEQGHLQLSFVVCDWFVEAD